MNQVVCSPHLTISMFDCNIHKIGAVYLQHVCNHCAKAQLMENNFFFSNTVKPETIKEEK